MTVKTWTHLHLPRLREGNPDCISVKQGRDPVFYVPRIFLRNVIFFVSAAGRERCLKENVRNVHAWVVGDPATVPECFEVDPTASRAIYDPWKGSAFVDAETLLPVESAESAYLVGKNVYYTGVAQ